MKSAALTHGSGPGSAIALSATSIRVRDAIIEKFIDKSLDELNSFLASALDSETDESKRIGILAARVYILRTRISKISEFNENPLMNKVEEVSPHELVNRFDDEEPEMSFDQAEAEAETELAEWNELVTIEDGEVNGVRIPSGVTITVGREDAARLLETGKAAQVAEDGSVVEDADKITADEPPEAPEAEDIANDDTLQEAESAPVVIAEDAGLPAEDMTTAEQVTDPITAEDTPAEDSAAEEESDESDQTQA